jgi:hypothetical protein
MFQLLTSHHQAEELKDFYKGVLHMKWLSSLRDIPFSQTNSVEPYGMLRLDNAVVVVGFP